MANPRILHSTAWYLPDGVGGTEVYIDGLIRELRKQGIESSVVVPRRAGAAQAYKYDGVDVETYPVSTNPGKAELRGAMPRESFDIFCDLLKKHQGSIYHQHSWTRGCGLAHLRAAREAGLATVVTVHVPGNTCMRGTMLRFGKTPCDGKVREIGCAACWAQSRGVPALVGKSIAMLPRSISDYASRGDGRIATALSARALAAARRKMISEMVAYSDRIVAVCDWLHAALAANGVPAEKLILSRQAVPGEFVGEAEAIRSSKAKRNGPIKMALLARFDPVKGIDIAVRAIRALPKDVDLHLSIHAIPSEDDAGRYEREVRALAAGDPRITFEPPIERTQLAKTLSNYDVLVVPSIWMETGPLVVLEAQAAGLYVVGSRRGGIFELLQRESFGELVEPGDVQAWAQAFLRLAMNFRKSELAPQVNAKVRTVASVAAEMAEIYRLL